MSKKYTWQQAFSDLITDPKELFALLELDVALLDGAFAAARSFPLKVPRRFVARMRKGSLQDPLLRQVLPLAVELETSLGYVADPLQEAACNPVPGLLHKYPGRVLVMLTGACAVHCRYCFRRHFPYAENNPGRRGWENIFAYIRQDQTICEVILSGGDPLTVSDALLQSFSDQLQQIPHVKRLRLHTRLPVVLPERVTEELIHWLTQLLFDPVIVIHANHAQEIDAEVKAGLRRLRQAGIPILNQAVLLRGVNDHIEALVSLSETLWSAGVSPYYLHVLDKVQGAAHFDLEPARLLALKQALQRQLPGYLVPRWVYEVAGAESKQLF
jgi:L-lysine 2,3-aminomutase